MNSLIPNFLIEMLKEQYGEEISNKIIEGYSSKRPITLRVNNIKSNADIIEKELENLKIKFKRVAWYKDGFILENVNKDDIEQLEIYKNGEIYLQSLSSMLPPIILNPKENEDILDMAAAPGGKTTQIASITQNKSNITACEINKIRVERLKYNIEKQGATSTYVMVKDAQKIDSFFSFDQILLDAPCSGSGTLSCKDKNIDKYFTYNLIKKSTQTQFNLLKKAIKILKPGKTMVYSTCSILSCENEEIIRKVLKESDVEIVPIELKNMQDIPLLPVTLKGTLCVCPDELYEGFFVAKIRKNNN